MSHSRPGLLDYLLLGTLAVIWGAAFPLSKVAVADYPPLTLTLAWQAVATIALLIVVATLRRAWFKPTPADLFNMFICALLGSVVPFTLINWGVEKVDSGLAAILMGFMPLMTLVIAHFFTDEKMTVPKLAGIACGIAGLAILFWPSLRAGFGDNLFRQAALLGAATCYAVSALFLRRLVHRTPVVVLAYIGIGTVLLLTPVSFVVDDPLSISPTLASTTAMVVLGLLSYTAGAMFMFAIISRQGVVFFGQINLLVPVAGVLLGVIFLGERPNLQALVALAIIFSGIMVARINPSNKKTIPQGSHP